MRQALLERLRVVEKLDALRSVLLNLRILLDRSEEGRRRHDLYVMICLQGSTGIRQLSMADGLTIHIGIG